MSVDIISAIIGFIGVIIGVIPTYFFMRQKNLAVIENLRAGTDKARAEAEKIRAELKVVPQSTIENEKSHIILDDRSGFTTPLEVRCKNAQEICFLGISLRGVISHHVEFFLAKAKEGCKIRFLIVDPGSLGINGVPEFSPDLSQEELIISRTRDVVNVIEWLKPLLKTGNVELRFTNIVPPYALTMIDPATNHGEVQVGLFVYKATSGASERPHFILTSSNSEKWYRFFKSQFEKIWIDSSRHE